MKNILKRFLLPFVGIFLVLSFATATPVFAEPTATPAPAQTAEPTATPEPEELSGSELNEQASENCYTQVGAISWIICPTTGVLSNAIDSLYGIIEQILIVPTSQFSDLDSPAFLIWQYIKDIANIVFVIFLFIVIFSQLTSIGINNYGIKRTLPRLIIAILLVNLSFTICALAVDVSNILGSSLHGFIENIEQQAIASGNFTDAKVSWTDLSAAIIAGGGLTVAGIAVSGGLSAFLWILLGAAIGAILAVLVGFITLALRQAVIFLLVMISPLALVAYLLPNTEKYFSKWLHIFVQMLTFYPLFSLLFGASQLAGWAIIASASGNIFWVIVGLVVQVAPLILSVSLMRMSGTVLGTISSRLNDYANRGSSTVRSKWINPNVEERRQSYIHNAATPGANLRRYLDYRRTRRELNIQDNKSGRLHLAMTRAQNYQAGGKRIAGVDESVKPNRETREHKKTMNEAMEAATAARDAEHVFGNYGDYFNSTNEDVKLSDDSAYNAMEADRSVKTLQNDSRADVEWLTKQYDNILKQTDADGNPLSSDAMRDTYRYRHYIRSAGGALGEKGTVSVLAQVKAAAKKSEIQAQKDFRILNDEAEDLPVNFRSMMAGYMVNGDGIASDFNQKPLKDPVTGKQLETIPGELLRRDPSKLVPYQYKNLDNGKWVDDQNGPFIDLHDPKGNFLTRVYKNDTPIVKEVLKNSDMVINDQMNSLYSVLSGVDEGSIPELPEVGLSKYSKEIGFNIDSVKYRDKFPGVNPMVTAAMRGQKFHNAPQFAMYQLDAYAKSAKPNTFNLMDPNSANQLAYILDPKNFDTFYDDAAITEYANIIGNQLYGIEYQRDSEGNPILDPSGKPITVDVNGVPQFDSDGNSIEITIPHDDATPEQIRQGFIKKILAPGSSSAVVAMAGMNSRIADAQTKGTAEALAKLRSILASYNDPEIRAKYPGLPDLSEDLAYIEINNSNLANRRHRVVARAQADAGDSNPDTAQPSSPSANDASHSSGDTNDSQSPDNASASHPPRPSDFTDPTFRDRLNDAEQNAESNNDDDAADVLNQLDDIYDNHLGETDASDYINDVLDYFSNHPRLNRCADDFDAFAVATPGATIDELHNEAISLALSYLNY